MPRKELQPKSGNQFWPVDARNVHIQENMVYT